MYFIQIKVKLIRVFDIKLMNITNLNAFQVYIFKLVNINDLNAVHIVTTLQKNLRVSRMLKWNPAVMCAYVILDKMCIRDSFATIIIFH